MLPIKIERQITTSITDYEDCYFSQREDCLSSRIGNIIEWYTPINIQKDICMEDLFTLIADLRDNIKDLRPYLQRICQNYANDVFSPLYRFSRDGRDPACNLLINVIALAFDVDENELISFFIPKQLQYDISDELASTSLYQPTNSTHKSDLISRIQLTLTETSLKTRDYRFRSHKLETSKHNVLVSAVRSKLLRSVLTSFCLFDLEPIQKFDFSMHIHLHRVLGEASYRDIATQLYVRNRDWLLLGKAIEELKHQQDNCLRNKIQFLQENLRHFGFRKTGMEIASRAVAPIVGEFLAYLENFPDSLQSDIRNTLVQSKELTEISLSRILNDLEQCIDTAATRLDDLLQATNYQHLLSLVPDSKNLVAKTMCNYTKTYCSSLRLLAEVVVDVPKCYIQRALKDIPIFNAEQLMIVLGNFACDDYDDVFSAIRLQFMPQQPLEQLESDFLRVYTEFVFILSSLELRSQQAFKKVMAKRPQEFWGVEVLTCLSIYCADVDFLKLLGSKIVAMPLARRYAILGAKLEGHRPIPFFLCLIENPILLASFLQCFTPEEFYDWFSLPVPEDSFSRRLVLLDNLPGLEVILNFLTIPLIVKLMFDLRTMHQPCSIVVEALNRSNVHAINMIFNRIPEDQRLALVNRCRLLRIWTREKPNMIECLLTLLPISDREAAVCYEEPYMRNLLVKLCDSVSKPNILNCIKVILGLLPYGRLFSILTKIESEYGQGQTLLHYVTAKPHLILTLFSFLTREQGQAALECRNRAGERLRDCIKNKKTLKALAQSCGVNIAIQPEEMEIHEGSSSSSSSKPFFQNKKRKVGLDSDDLRPMSPSFS